MKGSAAGVLAAVILAIGAWYFSSHRRDRTISRQAVSYTCDAGKTIRAVYIEDASKPSAKGGQRPALDGSVRLSLSDGRGMMLPQTISGSGIRYADPDESFVFWSKGNGAFVTENGRPTYSGCIRVAQDPGGLPNVFESGREGFSLRYPAGFTVDENYVYQALGPAEGIRGVKFTIAPSIAAGTNLGTDTYVSVEKLPKAGECSATLYLEQGAVAANLIDSGVTYSVASSAEAGAGNRYEETVYAIPGTHPCIAMRYFIHYSVFENYPAGTVKRFDKASLKATFDSIRRTLTLAP